MHDTTGLVPAHGYVLHRALALGVVVEAVSKENTIFVIGGKDCDNKHIQMYFRCIQGMLGKWSIFLCAKLKCI